MDIGRKEQLVNELREIMNELDLAFVKNNGGFLILKKNKSYSIAYHS